MVPAKGAAWTAEEKVKIALLISLMESGGNNFSWAKAALPEGRTRGTCQKQFAELKSLADTVPMATGNAITPASVTPSKRRHKKPNLVNETDGVVDEEGTPSKVAKDSNLRAAIAGSGGPASCMKPASPTVKHLRTVSKQSADTAHNKIGSIESKHMGKGGVKREAEDSSDQDYLDDSCSDGEQGPVSTQKPRKRFKK